MCEAKLEPDVVIYSNGISACEKGVQWNRALELVTEMLESIMDPNANGYNPGTSPCEEGEQWHQARHLLGEMRKAKLEFDVFKDGVGSSARKKASCPSGSRPCADHSVCAPRELVGALRLFSSSARVN
ncbi:unnamed protein product [Prorocentrum cordatum]|uniref:Uncharacterized protein n=1 Tax=Prorocentrum cordatum TaxID=2364126 RepID=A0ABN9ST67_9DINO|nr:unnamed protein product [Polarella glacialis]